MKKILIFAVAALAVSCCKVDYKDPTAPIEKRVESLLDEYDLRASQDNVARIEFITYADEEYGQRLRDKALEGF